MDAKMFFRLIFFFLFSSIFCCPDGSLPWNNYCYIFYSTETEYAKAEIICQKNGGHLASIHDAFTNAIIAQNAPDQQLWIGANSLTTKNVWEWTDGSNFDFNDWRKGEPKNISDSLCASMSNKDGYWSAESCFTFKPFVCELLNTDTITTTMKTTAKTLSSTTTNTKTITLATKTTALVTDATSSSPPLPVLQHCSSGWTYFAPTNSFYCGNYSSLLPWSAAEKYCISIGGHLTSVHSDLEFRLIRPCEGPWLGLYTVDNGTTYQWTDGSNFDYQKWWYGYPDVNYGTCVMTMGRCTLDDIGGFDNWDCSGQWGIVCKKARKSLNI